MSNNIVNRVKASQANFNVPLNQEVTMNADGSGGPISINTGKKYNPVSPNKGWKDWAHGALDLAGMIPGVGNVADVVNAGWYALEGDKTMAAASLAAAIPGAGLAAGATKIGTKVARAYKTADKALDAGKMVRGGVDDAVKVIKNRATGAVGPGWVKGFRGNPKSLTRTAVGLSEGVLGGIAQYEVASSGKQNEANESGKVATYKANPILESIGWDEDTHYKPKTPKKQRFNDGVAYTGRQHWKTFKK